MDLQQIMQEKKMSMYQLSKQSGIPYMTLHDLMDGKSSVPKSSAETVYRIAQALNMSVEDLLTPYLVKRPSFDLFRSTVCHRLKEMDDIPFMISMLKEDEIRSYADRSWYPEAFYLLAMLDYLSRLHDIPLCSAYDDLRQKKLSAPLFPSSVILLSSLSDNSRAKEESIQNAIPEFLRFNIVECEVRDVA